MTAYEKYTFFLCLIVFIALTALFTTLLTYVVRLTVRLIRHGAEDDNILQEYYKNKGLKKRVTAADWIARIFSFVVCVALCGVFVFAVLVRINENDFSDQLSSLRVVKSSSMSQKYEKNQYLYQNQLDDQIQMLDLVVTDPLPGEFELELYDIVVYEQNDQLIIHRIVSIEEPNESHPNERYFRLQGDAVETADRFPVHYSQMRAIYRGERIPFLGSFVAFMQSPAGYLCILLVLFAVIATPRVEKKITKEKELRLEAILGGTALYGSRTAPRIEVVKGGPGRMRPKCCRRCQGRGCGVCTPPRINLDVKALNINMETRRGKALWMHLSLSNKVMCHLDCKKREQK